MCIQLHTPLTHNSSKHAYVCVCAIVCAYICIYWWSEINIFATCHITRICTHTHMPRSDPASIHTHTHTHSLHPIYPCTHTPHAHTPLGKCLPFGQGGDTALAVATKQGKTEVAKYLKEVAAHPEVHTLPNPAYTHSYMVVIFAASLEHMLGEIFNISISYCLANYV